MVGFVEKEKIVFAFLCCSGMNKQEDAKQSAKTITKCEDFFSISFNAFYYSGFFSCWHNFHKSELHTWCWYKRWHPRSVPASWEYRRWYRPSVRHGHSRCDPKCWRCDRWRDSRPTGTDGRTERERCRRTELLEEEGRKLLERVVNVHAGKMAV